MKEPKEFIRYPGGITMEDPRYVGGSLHGLAEVCGEGRQGFGCTLSPGHEGPHAAHGMREQLYAVWPQEP